MFFASSQRSDSKLETVRIFQIISQIICILLMFWGLSPNSTCLTQSARFSEFLPLCMPDPCGISAVLRNSGELGDNPDVLS